MKAIQISDNIYWVGGIDWDVRNFHGYLTQRGSTYNAYLIIDENITLIDTVKHHLFNEMMERISSVIDPAKIDYVISNHVEMDHSGALPRLMEQIPHATVYTSANGEKGLRAHYGGDWNFEVVPSGGSLSLGNSTLRFVHTPMVHWPDNMMVYLEEEKILFSNDAFGQHIASSERFDDQFPIDITMEEATKYYANIVLPFGGQVQKALDAASGLDIGMIAPSHGLLWRSHIPAILEQYQNWSTHKTEERAVIVYDTMWDSTDTIARAIQSAFENQGMYAQVMNLRNNHISDIMTKVLTSKYICVGSPTLNNGIMPTVGGFLTYLKGLAPKKRVGLAFGSYGWSGQSVGIVEDVLKDCGFEMMERIRIQYIPGGKQLEEIRRQVEKEIEQHR